MGSLHKNTLSVLEFLKAPFFVLHLSYKIFMTFRMICNIVILLMNTTLYSKFDQVPVLWQQLGFVSELESDLQGIVDWDRNWLVEFNAWKQLVSFDWSNNTVAINVKMDRFVLEDKSSFKILGLLFFSELE